jgi:hypothetical protein
MSYQEEALDLISRPENIAAALEISRLVEALKPQFQKDFWMGLTAKIESMLQETELAASWQVVVSEHYDAKWGGLVVKPKEVMPNQRYIRVKLQQQEKQRDYPLIYGMVYDREFPQWKQIPELNELGTSLQNQGFGERDIWWLGYKYTDYSIWKHDFMMRMGGTEREAFIEEMANLLLNLLSYNLGAINAVNAALSRPPYLFA